jgi:hypothetical protein
LWQSIRKNRLLMLDTNPHFTKLVRMFARYTDVLLAE